MEGGVGELLQAEGEDDDGAGDEAGEDAEAGEGEAFDEGLVEDLEEAEEGEGRGGVGGVEGQGEPLAEKGEESGRFAGGWMVGGGGLGVGGQDGVRVGRWEGGHLRGPATRWEIGREERGRSALVLAEASLEGREKASGRLQGGKSNGSRKRGEAKETSNGGIAVPWRTSSSKVFGRAESGPFRHLYTRRDVRWSTRWVVGVVGVVRAADIAFVTVEEYADGLHLQTDPGTCTQNVERDGGLHRNLQLWRRF